MKKKYTYIITFLILIILLIPINNVYADSSQYFYIKEDTDFIIIDDKITGSFRIKATWYVEMTGEADINDNGSVYKIVRYKGIKGKVIASALSIKTCTVSGTPYFTPSVNPKSVGNPKAHLYNSDKYIYSEAINAGIELDYIGIRANEYESYFVRIKTENDGYKYGFILKDNVDTTILVNNNPSAFNPDNNSGDGNSGLTPPGDETKVTENNLLRGLLITAICVLAVLVVFLIFKPVKSKSPKKKDYYEDN